MNISRKLAEFVVNTGFEDIPAEVIDVEKKSILDNIAIISGGAYGDGCREFVEFAEEAAAGGRGEATVLGYNKKLPEDCILAQSPGEGTKVKEGHMVYVTVNAPSSPTFAIPDIVDNSSYREAMAKLTAMGFRLSPTQYVTGEKDWVYGILCRGRRVSNGDRVPIDYPLTLMVGSGTYDDSSDVDYVDSNYSNDVMGDGDVDDFEEVTEPPVAEKGE